MTSFLLSYQYVALRLASIPPFGRPILSLPGNGYYLAFQGDVHHAMTNPLCSRLDI